MSIPKHMGFGAWGIQIMIWLAVFSGSFAKPRLSPMRIWKGVLTNCAVKVCRENTTEANNKLYEHRMNLSRIWKHEAQMKVDVSQLGVDLLADKKKFSEVPYNQTWADIEASRLKHRIDSTNSRERFTAAYQNLTFIGQGSNNTTLNMTAKDRSLRMAPSTLIPLVSALSPGISVFMNKLIAPLIQGVTHRPTSPYKDQLIQKFTSRALEGTRIQDT